VIKITTETYTLPEISYVGGETQNYSFNLKTISNVAFNVTGGSVNFALISYSNKTGTPLLSKSATLAADGNGIVSIAKVTLLPTETKSLFGKYIYQLTIKDIENYIAIPAQGIMTVSNNINKTFIS